MKKNLIGKSISLVDQLTHLSSFSEEKKLSKELKQISTALHKAYDKSDEARIHLDRAEQFANIFFAGYQRGSFPRVILKRIKEEFVNLQTSKEEQNE